jgi:hypothetical protein
VYPADETLHRRDALAGILRTFYGGQISADQALDQIERAVSDYSASPSKLTTDQLFEELRQRLK